MLSNSSIDKNFYFSTSVIIIPIVFIMLMWLGFYIDYNYYPDLFQYGILPKTMKGLRGIPLHIFIHGDFKHLLHNTFPIFFLIASLKYFYRKQFWKVLLLGIVFSGIGTWLIGRNSYHIGASGLIYCLVSFMFFKGIMTKYFRLIALSLTIVILYGGTIWFMFPSQHVLNEGISWEAHFMGFLVGFFFSILFKTPQFEKPIYFEWEHPDFDPKQAPFFKQFDEKGNFINPPKPEIFDDSKPDVENYFTSSLKVIYEFLGRKG